MADGVAVIGGGGHARVVAEALVACGMTFAGHVAPEADKTGLLWPHLGDDADLPELVRQGLSFALGVGFVNADGAQRRAMLLALLGDLGAPLASVVHPSAMLSPSARIEEGCFLAAGAILGTRSCLGRGSIVNSGAIVDHDAIIGANTHIATGARLAGGITLGSDVLVGAGAVLRQSVQVEDRAIIGAGAVVLGTVHAGTTVFGNPARERRT